MTYEEYEAELDKLNKAKKGYDGNRTLCAAVMVLVAYYTFKDKDYLTTPWYILLIFGLVFAASAFILVRDCLLIRKISGKIKELEAIDEDSLEHAPVTADKSNE